MKIPILVLSVALAAACAGCVVHGHRGHVSAGVTVASHCDHHYLYYPDHDAYHCGGCGFWWAIDGGAWVEFRTRPSHIVLSPSPVVVEVRERGPSPWCHRDNHRGKGPTPGRVWKK